MEVHICIYGLDFYQVYTMKSQIEYRVHFNVTECRKWVGATRRSLWPAQGSPAHCSAPTSPGTAPGFGALSWTHVPLSLLSYPLFCMLLRVQQKSISFQWLVWPLGQMSHWFSTAQGPCPCYCSCQLDRGKTSSCLPLRLLPNVGAHRDGFAAS